jgi:GDP-4-dehydro-6-deoxy-D-mannose reductase
LTKVLITGATGFAGSHLADYLLDSIKAEVHGLIRPRSRTEFVRSDVIYHEADITDYSAVATVVREIQPDFIFHLAAQSFVPLSFKAPTPTLVTNITGTLHVLEAVKQECPDAIVQIAGSSEEYGLVEPHECPIVESQPFRPMSPYALSKVGADLLAQQYHRSYKIKTVITRAFNHSGPRRGKSFVTSKIALATAQMIVNEAKPIIQLGNLDAVRDFTDVRDTVKAYWMLANTARYGEPYNIGTGVGHSIKELVNIFRNISEIDFKVEQNPEFMRPSDVPLLLCNPMKTVIATGWEPTVPFEETMMNLLDYWINELRKEKLGK